MFSGILLHTLLSSATVFLTLFLNLPSLTLHSIHTYINPNSLPPAATAAGETSLSVPNPRRRSKAPTPSSFQDSNSQLFRLRLSESLIPSRHFFSSYLSTFISSSVSLSNLALSIFSPFSNSPIAFAAALISSSHLLISLLNLSLHRPASRHSHRRLALLSSLTSFLSAFLILPFLDFQLPAVVFPVAASFAGFLGGVLFTPAARSARSFWIGTDQLRWNLNVVSSGTSGRVFLFISIISSFFAPLLWVKPPLGLAKGFEEGRAWVLAGAAASQLVALRANVQAYLNEAVLCWYQRLHSSRVPDLDYGRAKVFLHDHYVLLAVIQFAAPGLVVMILVGLSQLRGNLFDDIPFAGGLMNWSDLVKEMALFIAWWTMFVRSVLIMLLVGVYRCGFAFVS